MCAPGGLAGNAVWPAAIAEQMLPVMRARFAAPNGALSSVPIPAANLLRR